jgi:hypothetical protein
MDSELRALCASSAISAVSDKFGRLAARIAVFTGSKAGPWEF